MMTKTFVVLGVVALMLVMPVRAYFNIAGTRRGGTVWTGEECPANYAHYCLNGGTCETISELDTHFCHCFVQFTGVRCEQMLPQTHTSCTAEESQQLGNCLNGGQCALVTDASSNGSGVPVCMCPQGYHGSRCGLGSSTASATGSGVPEIEGSPTTIRFKVGDRVKLECPYVGWGGVWWYLVFGRYFDPDAPRPRIPITACHSDDVDHDQDQDSPALDNCDKLKPWQYDLHVPGENPHVSARNGVSTLSFDATSFSGHESIECKQYERDDINVEIIRNQWSFIEIGSPEDTA